MGLPRRTLLFSFASDFQDGFWGRNKNVCLLLLWSLGAQLIQTWAGPVHDVTALNSNVNSEVPDKEENGNGTRREKEGRKENGHESPAKLHMHFWPSSPSFWSGRTIQVAPLLASFHMVSWELESKRRKLTEYFIVFISHPNMSWGPSQQYLRLFVLWF